MKPKRILPALAISLLAVLLSVSSAHAITPIGENPCAGPEAKVLLCPNLRIAPPHELYVDHAGGRTRLHATSDVRSRGRGPMELHGTRNGWRTMRVRQRIYRAGGGHITVPTLATLRFTSVGAYFGGSYWKVHQLAHFELWSVDGQHQLLHRVRVGPKLNYCLRDLERTRPANARRRTFTTPAATRTPTSTTTPSAPRSVGQTSTPPTTTSSGSTSAACTAASPS